MPIEASNVNMKKKSVRRVPRPKANELRTDYDFSGGARGKHAARYAAGTNVVVLAPDVAAMFPDAEAVNSALRALAEIVKRRPLPRRRGKRA